LTPQVSVILSAYNYEPFVAQAIESVLQQTLDRRLVEIIAVDDGSTDGTADRIASFGSAVRLLRKPNGGQASAFNAGVEVARAPFVAFLDADDVWLPGKLANVLNAFEAHPEAGLVSHATLIERGGRRIPEDGPPPPNGDLRSVAPLLELGFPATSALTVSRRVLERLLPFPDEFVLSVDYYVFNLAPLYAPVVGLREPLSIYRIHGGNAFADNRRADVVELRLKLGRRMVELMGHHIAQAGLPLPPGFETYAHNENITRLEGELVRLGRGKRRLSAIWSSYVMYAWAKFGRARRYRTGLKNLSSITLELLFPSAAARARALFRRSAGPAPSAAPNAPSLHAQR
jgi:glycosyltransferase involved in cell wall biosynthesis